MSRYIHLSKYSRWRPRLKRRETWEETCDRLIDFWKDRHLDVLGEDVFVELRQSLVNLEAVPSMRCLMTAGEALNRDNVAAFNCCSTGVSHIRVFDEIFYLLMNGCGVGFSVESKYISKLPIVAENHYPTDTVISVRDSKIGWAKGLKELIALLYNGDVPTWDLSKVRPAGARLKTFGGRACLTGDTILYKDRKKTRGYNEITIKQLFDMENSQGFFKGKANHFKDVKLRSLDESSGIFFRNKVITVIDNGLSPVYEIVTENGYRIKATGNHRFMFETGEYKYLDDFTVGSLIAVNGSKERKTGICVDCGREISRRALRCKPCYDAKQLRGDALNTTARQRKQNRDYVSDICEVCGSSGRIEVHHVDKNPHNNEHNNLECLCSSCHQHLHAVERTFSDPYSHKYLSFDRIISIEYAGEDRVYDLQMEAPNHNFIANGFVSHNSGPEPLDKLFHKVVQIITNANGRRLNSLECHDLICWIAMTVIVGSVRRSACISLGDLEDSLMRRAKQGQWYYTEPQRALANNSAMYDGRPSLEDFIKEFGSMYKSKAGERGVINKQALRRKAESCGREHDGDYVVNPCVEAILRDTGGLCNLSEAIVRATDTYEDIAKKVRIATIFGTLQSTLVDFRYLRKIWRTNQEEERLLGVSLTGIMDNELMRTNDTILEVTLQGLKKIAVDTNREFAELLGIPASKQLTLVID